MYNIVKTDEETNGMILKSAIKKKIMQDIVKSKIFSVINWEPDYKSIIESKNHEQMFKYCRERFMHVDVSRFNLLYVFKLNLLNKDIKIAYIWSPIDLWQNEYLLLMDDFPKHNNIK